MTEHNTGSNWLNRLDKETRTQFDLYRALIANKAFALEMVKLIEENEKIETLKPLAEYEREIENLDEQINLMHEKFPEFQEYMNIINKEVERFLENYRETRNSQ